MSARVCAWCIERDGRKIDHATGPCAALIFDEFHERSLDADLSLALATDVRAALRPDLRLVVMSATLGEVGPATVGVLAGAIEK